MRCSVVALAGLACRAARGLATGQPACCACPRPRLGVAAVALGQRRSPTRSRVHLRLVPLRGRRRPEDAHCPPEYRAPSRDDHAPAGAAPATPGARRDRVPQPRRRAHPQRDLLGHLEVMPPGLPHPAPGHLRAQGHVRDGTLATADESGETERLTAWLVRQTDVRLDTLKHHYERWWPATGRRSARRTRCSIRP